MRNIRILIFLFTLFVCTAITFVIVINQETDEEYFDITTMEKWNDLQNKQAIDKFTLDSGYTSYEMTRYTNGKMFCNNDVLNPLDAYILMINNDDDFKIVEYREYKTWLLTNEIKGSDE